MTRIREAKWVEYTANLARINRKAAEELEVFAEKHGLDDRQALIDFGNAVVQKYSEGSAELACEMYDAIADLQNAHVQAAEPADMPTYQEIAKGINGVLKQSPDGKTIGDPAARLVKRTASDTILKNAIRDRAEFAWIPSGDSCAFCAAIASRGWQPASKAAVSGGHAEHIHANCRCEYAIRFSSDMNVEGYDPDKLREEYDAAKGSTSAEKINSMRRARNHNKTGDMTSKEYAEFKRELEAVKNAKQIFLPKDEYAHVMSELNTYMTEEDRKHAIITKPIGNHYYTILNKGFDNYTIIGKDEIDSEIDQYIRRTR